MINFEYRRGMSRGKMAIGGGIGTIVIALIVLLLVGDPSQLLSTMQGGTDTEQVQSACGFASSASSPFYCPGDLDQGDTFKADI